MRTMCVAVITAYRFLISPWLGPACRFEPTCSEYACQAIDHFGVLHVAVNNAGFVVVKGCGLTIWRLLRCHPFHRGGYDPLLDETQRQGVKHL